MSWFSRISAVLFLFALAPWSDPVPAAAPGEETVIYHGEISAARNQEFFRRIVGKPVKQLRISSGGGEVEAGIELGYWVFDNRLDVEVAGVCLSSCANYVFPAGAVKRILPGGVVAWHGNYRHLKETGLWHDDVRSRMEKYGEDEETARHRALVMVNGLVDLEDEFFRHIEVNEYVCWIGKMPPYNVPDYYALSADDMARFGINEVRAPPGYPSLNHNDSQADIVYLHLSGSAVHNRLNVQQKPAIDRPEK